MIRSKSCASGWNWELVWPGFPVSLRDRLGDTGFTSKERGAWSRAAGPSLTGRWVVVPTWR